MSTFVEDHGQAQTSLMSSDDVRKIISALTSLKIQFPKTFNVVLYPSPYPFEPALQLALLNMLPRQ